MIDDRQLHQLLAQRFGFEQFRPGQKEAIQALLQQKRLICIQPTGHGKSLLYQLPALLLDGITVVVSPLLALMRDQMTHLSTRFHIPSGSINSDQEEAENEATRRAALDGELRILFLAPEQLDNLDVSGFLKQLRISLMVVDEAHCISTWGHDFRPAYRVIVRAARFFAQHNPDLHLLALTATADARVEADIAKQLEGPDGTPPKVMRATMDRPNIALAQVSVNDLAHKLAWLAENLAKLEGCGILYCATREQTEIVADYLRSRGIDAGAYHAGFDAERKRQLQRAFLTGKPRVISATNALGMGIDKADLRFIVHVDMPGSITAYYQEVGRAGRDGEPARGILLYLPEDRKIQEHFIHSAQPTRDDFLKTLSVLMPDEEGMFPSLAQVKVRTGLHPTRVTVILAELREQGFVEKRRQGTRQVYRRTEHEGEPNLERYERQHATRTKELEAMLRFAQGQSGCLMQTLRTALGDTEAQPCGRCSQCQPEHWTGLSAKVAEHGEQNWLVHRPVTIPESKRPKHSEGFALLNGEQRTPLFAAFMRGRTGAADQLPEALISLLDKRLDALLAQYAFAAVVPLPSRTWAQRDWLAALLAKKVGAQVWDGLHWQEMPANRQGELLNNDQRKNNVTGKMGITGPPPRGALLLLDDYWGSGTTLKEAANTLRGAGGFAGHLVPLVVARIRWRLGTRGFI